MNEQQRQTVYLGGIMVLLVVAVLYLFVYAPEPLEPYRPSGSSIVGVLKTIFNAFNLFS